MSTAALLRRVNKLEESAESGGVRAILWAGPGQDAAQVEADHVAGHPNDVGKTLVISWQEVAA